MSDNVHIENLDINEDSFCVERVEQILMSNCYNYNEKYNHFEKEFSNESFHFKTVAINKKSNSNYYLLIDTRTVVSGITQIKINYLSQLPDSESDFKILCSMLDVFPNANTKVDLDKITKNFIKLLVDSDYIYNKSNNKYYKEIESYNSIPTYLSITIDVKNDLFKVSEEYDEYNLIHSVEDLHTFNSDSVLTLYYGKIPKSIVEFHVISNLIDFSF